MNTTCINHTRKTDSIPLNDEFLTAFGKREKEYDELVGRSTDIDKTSLDVIDVHDSDEDDGGGGVSNIVNKVNYSAVSTGKVRMIVFLNNEWAVLLLWLLFYAYYFVK